MTKTPLSCQIGALLLLMLACGRAAGQGADPATPTPLEQRITPELYKEMKEFADKKDVSADGTLSAAFCRMIDRLMDDLASADDRKAWEATQQLGQVGKGLTPLVRRRLEGTLLTGSQANALVGVLARHGGPADDAVILRYAVEGDLQTRQTAQFAMLRRKARSAVQPLIEQIDSQSFLHGVLAVLQSVTGQTLGPRKPGSNEIDDKGAAAAWKQWLADKTEVFAVRAMTLAKDNAQGHFDLGVWCDENFLMREAAEEFERVLLVQPEHTEAHKRLGHVKVKNQWVSEEAQRRALFEESLARALEKGKSELPAIVTVGLIEKLLGPLVEHALKGGEPIRARFYLKLLRPRSSAHLQRMLTDLRLAKQRPVILRLLGQIGAVEAIPDLAKLLRDKDPSVRQAALAALGETGDGAAVEHVAGLVRTGDEVLAQAALDCLGKFHTKEVVPVWIDLLTTDRISDTALSRLRELTGRSFGSCLTPEQVAGAANKTEAGRRLRTLAADWKAWWEAVRNDFTLPPGRPARGSDVPLQVSSFALRGDPRHTLFHLWNPEETGKVAEVIADPFEPEILWVNTGHGLRILEPATGKILSYPPVKAPVSPYAVDETGLWRGEIELPRMLLEGPPRTWHGTLTVLDRTTGRRTEIRQDFSLDNPLMYGEPLDRLHRTGGERKIDRVFCDPAGFVLAVCTEGAVRLQKQSGSMTGFLFPHGKHAVSACLDQGSSERFWMVNAQQELLLVQATGEILQTLSLRSLGACDPPQSWIPSLCGDDPEFLWVSPARNEILRIHRISGKVDRLNLTGILEPDPIAPSGVTFGTGPAFLRLTTDPDALYWWCCPRLPALVRIDRQKLEPTLHRLRDVAGLRAIHAPVAAAGTASTLWFATDNGVLKFTADQRWEGTRYYEVHTPVAVWHSDFSHIVEAANRVWLSGKDLWRWCAPQRSFVRTVTGQEIAQRLNLSKGLWIRDLGAVFDYETGKTVAVWPIVDDMTQSRVVVLDADSGRIEKLVEHPGMSLVPAFAQNGNKAGIERTWTDGSWKLICIRHGDFSTSEGMRRTLFAATEWSGPFHEVKYEWSHKDEFVVCPEGGYVLGSSNPDGCQPTVFKCDLRTGTVVPLLGAPELAKLIEAPVGPGDWLRVRLLGHDPRVPDTFWFSLAHHPAPFDAGAARLIFRLNAAGPALDVAVDLRTTRIPEFNRMVFDVHDGEHVWLCSSGNVVARINRTSNAVTLTPGTPAWTACDADGYWRLSQDGIYRLARGADPDLVPREALDVVTASVDPFVKLFWRNPWSLDPAPPDVGLAVPAPDAATIAAWIGQLTGKDHKKRTEARERLAAHPTEVVPHLVRKLQEQNPEQKIEIIRVLAATRDPGVIDPLVGAAAAEPELLVEPVRAGLRGFKSTDLLPAIEKHLQSSSWKMRTLAIDLLSECPPATVVARMATLAADPDPEVRLRAADWLVKEAASMDHGKPAFTFDFHAVMRTLLKDSSEPIRRDAVVWYISQPDVNIRRDLRAVLFDEDVTVRWTAADQLALLGDLDALGVLVEYWRQGGGDWPARVLLTPWPQAPRFKEDEGRPRIWATLPEQVLDAELVRMVRSIDPRVRILALEMLARGQRPEVLPALRRALWDRIPEVRRVAGTLLAEAGFASALPALVQALEQARPPEQEIWKALKRFGTPPDVTAATKSCEVRAARREQFRKWWNEAFSAPAEDAALTADFRAEIITGIALLRDPAESPRFRRLLADADPAVRIAAALGLAVLGQADGLSALTGAAGAGELRHRLAAIEAIGHLASDGSCPTVAAFARDPEPLVRKAAIAALERMTVGTACAVIEPFLVDVDPVVRADAAVALGSRKAYGSAERIVPLLADAVPEVREAAIWALLECRHPKVASACLESKQALRRLQGLELLLIEPDRSLVAQVAALLSDSETAIRRYAAWLLLALADQSTAPALTKAVADPDARVRQSAVLALGTLSDAGLAGTIAETLRDPDPWVRHAGSEALRALGGKATARVPAGEDEHAPRLLHEILGAQGRDSSASNFARTPATAVAGLPCIERAIPGMDSEARLDALKWLSRTTNRSAALVVLRVWSSSKPNIADSARQVLVCDLRLQPFVASVFFATATRRPGLPTLTGDSLPPWNLMSAGAYPAVVALLQGSGSADTVRTVVGVLGWSRDPAAIPLLRAVLPTLRGPGADLALRDTLAGLHALGCLRTVVETAIELLDHAEVPVRMMACETLAEATGLEVSLTRTATAEQVREFKRKWQDWLTTNGARLLPME